MTNILILDASQRSALAATRSLGNKCFRVFTADTTKWTISGASKFSFSSLVYPEPTVDEGGFIEVVSEFILSCEIDIVLPMTEVTTNVILRNRDKFKNVNIPLCDYEVFNRISDKYELFLTACKLDIPIPKTIFCDNSKDALSNVDKLDFPVVIKPNRSRILIDGNWISTSVKYAKSVEDLQSLFKEYDYLDNNPFLIQQYIEGTGQGLFALYDKGSNKVLFSHKRIREKPPSGGVSVLSESVEIDPYLKEISIKLLNHYKWHGVAMVEFKVAKDGKPYLMEINGRFWGTLQLAIDAGIDFPYYLVSLATKADIDYPHKYKVGIRCRWLLGDLDHLILVLKQNKLPNALSISKVTTTLNFFKLWGKNTQFEVNRIKDIKPFIVELWQYISKIVIK